VKTARTWRVLVAVLVVFAGSSVPADPAAAEGGGGNPTFPTFDGYLEFPSIQAPGDRDEFSWRVVLAEGQSLRSVSETEAWVEYESGLQALVIKAEGAKDGVGALVPTTLRVSEGDLVTLVVQDREGNSAAGGAPFAYPVVATTSWTGPEVTPIMVKGPPDEMEIAAERLAEQQAKEAREAAMVATPAALPPASEPASASRTCTVPSLHGLALRVAKFRLRAYHCGVGQIYLASGATTGKGKVVKQFRPAGTQLAAGAPVAVKLGWRRAPSG
jgi:hypothetical protein